MLISRDTLKEICQALLSRVAYFKHGQPRDREDAIVEHIAWQ